MRKEKKPEQTLEREITTREEVDALTKDELERELEKRGFALDENGFFKPWNKPISVDPSSEETSGKDKITIYMAGTYVQYLEGRINLPKNSTPKQMLPRRNYYKPIIPRNTHPRSYSEVGTLDLEQ
jgi:hypothetical protein